MRSWRAGVPALGTALDALPPPCAAAVAAVAALAAALAALACICEQMPRTVGCAKSCWTVSRVPSAVLSASSSRRAETESPPSLKKCERSQQRVATGRRRMLAIASRTAASTASAGSSTAGEVPDSAPCCAELRLVGGGSRFRSTLPLGLSGTCSSIVQ